jgi:demethylmenaquinone methyltransferase/2-methoxy-6-polyprenyl-1,4-benzoquinol methylase
MSEAEENGTGRETHFGFRAVPWADKAGLVRQVFDSVADRYDLMNDLMSVGIHRLWKDAMMDWLRPAPGRRLLDVGGGTGDIARRYRRRGGGPVIALDINEAMLRRGRDRTLDAGMVEGIAWLVGDAERLPIAAGSVDVVATAFCLRNVTDPARAVAEARRVLRPGGRFLCLEFSRVLVPVLDRCYDAYSFRVLPLLGELVANDRDAYQYLAESIRRFPDQEAFARIIAAAGLERIKVRSLSGGIAALHSAWRI